MSDLAQELRDYPAVDPRTVVVALDPLPEGYCIIPSTSVQLAAAELSRLQRLASEAVTERDRLREQLVRAKAAAFGDPPELHHLQPIEWLHTMIDECRQLGDEVNDPDSWWLMISEVEKLYSGMKSALPDEPSDGAIYAAVSQRDATPDELAELNAEINAALSDDLHGEQK